MSDSLEPHRLYSLPVSSVRGILQAGILEWVATSFSKVNRKVISHQSTQLAFPPGLEEVESNMKWLACVSGLCPTEKRAFQGSVAKNLPAVQEPQESRV